MVTFDEMRRDQVALKQQVEKLNERLDNSLEGWNDWCLSRHQYCSSSGIGGEMTAQEIQDDFEMVRFRIDCVERVIREVLGVTPDDTTKTDDPIKNRIDSIEVTQEIMKLRCADAIATMGNVLALEKGEDGFPRGKSARLDGIAKSIKGIADQVEKLEKYVDNDHECVISNVSQMINNEVERIWSEINKLYKNSEKIDQNNVDLLKKFNTFKDETGKTLKEHLEAIAKFEKSFNDLGTTVNKLIKLVDDNNKAEQSYLKGIEAKNQELTKQNKLLTIEVNDMEKRLNNLTDRLIKLEGTAVRSPVVEQPVKEEEWLTATACTAAIKEKFPALKDLKAEEFSNSMAWSRYVSEREGNSHNRKVMPIGVKLNAVRNDRKGNVEYNPAFIEKFADRVLKHRKASSEFQCKGVEE